MQLEAIDALVLSAVTGGVFLSMSAHKAAAYSNSLYRPGLTASPNMSLALTAAGVLNSVVRR